MVRKCRAGLPCQVIHSWAPKQCPEYQENDFALPCLKNPGTLCIIIAVRHFEVQALEYSETWIKSFQILQAVVSGRLSLFFFFFFSWKAYNNYSFHYNAKSENIEILRKLFFLAKHMENIFKYIITFHWNFRVAKSIKTLLLLKCILCKCNPNCIVMSVLHQILAYRNDTWIIPKLAG